MTALPIITRSVLRFPHISFDWKGADPDSAIGEINEDYIDEFNKINSLSCVAYIVACSEWIYYFIENNFTQQDKLNYQQCLSAYWVWICELPRKIPPCLNETDTLSPSNTIIYKEAIEIAIESIQNGIYSVADYETSVDAAFVTQLCEYILPKECEFIVWKKEVIDRLKIVFPANQEHYDKIKVPRSMFNTDTKLENINLDTECETLLKQEALTHNAYLPLTPI